MSPVISTDVRETRESAERTRFAPVGPITATDVQRAIQQVSTSIDVINPSPVDVTPYVPHPADTILFVNTSLGPMVINLLPGATRNGVALEIKDISGNASTNNISIVPSAGETIDGLDPLLVNIDYGGWKLYPRATGWTTAA